MIETSVTGHNFDVAVTECLPHLRLAALRLTGNVPDAEDILQDAIIRALKSWRTFDGRYPRAWMSMIVRRCFLDECRKRIHRCSEAETECADDAANSWSEYIDAQRALSQMHPDYRDVLELSMMGYTHEEIAVELGIPLGTSHSRLHRARLSVGPVNRVCKRP